ncbi:MAG TPA: hypothetical protein VEB22_15155 [Phycisphaerales bacterium]|nr:hypothetical protein [Phycisphaerales bacterium]
MQPPDVDNREPEPKPVAVSRPEPRQDGLNRRQRRDIQFGRKPAPVGK